jgi:hypothetical protein
MRDDIVDRRHREIRKALEDVEHQLIVDALVPMHQHVPDRRHVLKPGQLVWRYDTVFFKDREKIAKTHRLSPLVKRNEVVGDVDDLFYGEMNKSFHECSGSQVGLISRLTGPPPSQG